MDKIQENNFSKITLAAIEAAKKGAEILKNGFGSKLEIKKKPGKHNLVTQYDLLSEKTIIAFINEKFPDHSILSEEAGEIKKNNDVEWIIDPLDGTTNFVHSIPFFAVNIAVKKGNEIISSVTYNPISEEMFIAEKNKGAYLNEKKIEVSKTKNLNNAILTTGFSYDLIKNPEKSIEHFLSILKLGLPIRSLGCASLDLAYVASGKCDFYFEIGLGPWDCAAGFLLLQEAKGRATHLNGSEFLLKNKNSILATNSYLHLEILNIFKNL